MHTNKQTKKNQNLDFPESQKQLGKHEITWKMYLYLIEETPKHKYQNLKNSKRSQ